MEQLSGTDSLFLYQEQGNNFNHVSCLGIYDPSTAPNGKVRFRSLLNHFERRLRSTPALHRKLFQVPHEADRAYWIEEPEIDIEFHVRHIALPQPGDWRQLMIQVARLHSRPLDQSKPLWEIYVIEGLANVPDLPPGSFAILMKFHHAALHGQAVAQVIQCVHSLTAETDPPPRDDEVIYAERPPLLLQMYVAMLANGTRRALKLTRLSKDLVQNMAMLGYRHLRARIRGSTATDCGPNAPDFTRAPMTRFNQPVSPNRVVEAVGLLYQDMQTICARVPGISQDDVFVAVVGGALRSYLNSKGELPEETLRALIPINLRTTDADGTVHNDVSGIAIPVGSTIADPLKRLHAVHAGSLAAKARAESPTGVLLPGFVKELPHALADQVLRRTRLGQINTTIAHGRGSEQVLYAAGARAAHFYPVSVATDFVGLNHSGFHYQDVYWISVVSCRSMMPDPEFYADCLRQSFAEIVSAARKASAVAAQRTRRKTAVTDRKAAA